MNCQKFESVAGELARGQMMEAELRGDAIAHTNDCSNCSSLLRDEEMLIRGLRSLASEMSSLEAPASTEMSLLSAFRQRQVRVPLAVVQDHRRYWLAAVAALLLIVFSVVAVRWQGRGLQGPKEEARTTTVTPVAPEQAAVVKDENTSAVPQNVVDTSKPKRTPRTVLSRAALQAIAGNESNRNIANHAGNEIATEFMPLGYLNEATLQDGGQIVRVEVPRATLASFGVPVNMDRYNEKVKADILLGVDGLAHAIRFVQEKKLQ